ncbi:hypothetical protein LBMAG18_02360 [Alphaproteobacteria bacterium]|nr:hypothetical protein LBMAG18_02360 [Alphaproteobacteria bacterium]
MTSKNDNPLEQLGGFFEALFSACSGKDRKAVKTKYHTRQDSSPIKPNNLDKLKDNTIKASSQVKPNNQGNIFRNLALVFAPDKEEIKDISQDVRQMNEMARSREGGMGSEISKATKYFTGQETPGFITDYMDMITGTTPKYGLPLSQEQRDKTVEDLRKYSLENYSSDIFELRKKASSIANKLEEKDDFGYRYQSLAGAAQASGLSKDKLQNLFNYIDFTKSRALKASGGLSSVL